MLNLCLTVYLYMAASYNCDINPLSAIDETIVECLDLVLHVHVLESNPCLEIEPRSGCSLSDSLIRVNSAIY